MTTKELSRCLKAVANERRVNIIRQLLAAGPLTVGELARRIKLSFRSTSKHLHRLADCDIVTREQKSLEAWYRVERSHPIVRALQGQFE